MKRVIIAVLLLAGLLFFCIWAFQYLDHETAQLAHMVAETEQAVTKQDFQAATDYIDTAYVYWDNLAGIFGALVRHNELDDIETLFVGAKCAIENQDAQESLMQLSKLRSMLRHLPEMETPSFQNIF